MTFRMQIDPRSQRQLARALARFENKVIAEQVKPIIQEAAKAIKKDAVANLRRNRSKRSGALIKAIKIGSFRSDRRRGMVWAATGVKSQVIEHEGRRVNPAKYAHLVERGHISRRGAVPAKPFMLPAANKHIPGCIAAIVDRLRRLAAG